MTPLDMRARELLGACTPAELANMLAEAEAAMRDMGAGWRYVRRAHGDLYGVGWDRAQDAVDNALALIDAAAKGGR